MLLDLIMVMIVTIIILFALLSRIITFDNAKALEEYVVCLMVPLTIGLIVCGNHYLTNISLWDIASFLLWSAVLGLIVKRRHLNEAVNPT